MFSLITICITSKCNIIIFMILISITGSGNQFFYPIQHWCSCLSNTEGPKRSTRLCIIFYCHYYTNSHSNNFKRHYHRLVIFHPFLSPHYSVDKEIALTRKRTCLSLQYIDISFVWRRRAYSEVVTKCEKRFSYASHIVLMASRSEDDGWPCGRQLTIRQDV